MDKALVEKYFNGKCDHSETKEVLKWLQTPEGQEYLMHRIEQDIRVLDEYGDYFKYPELNSGELFSRIQKNKFHKKDYDKVKSWYSRTEWRKAAAVVLLVGILSLFFALFVLESGADTKVVTTQEGEIKTLVLPDSSKVIMHQNSSIEYLSAFEHREVMLKGKAYFEVEHNKNNPFLVFANNSYVKVLGTEFVVSENSENQRVEVGVRNGRVELGTRNLPDGEVYTIDDQEVFNGVERQYQPIEITDGEVGIYEKDKQPFNREPVNLTNYYDWVDEVVIDGSMSFQDTPLKQVIIELENKYGVECIIEDDKMGEKKFTSSFDDETLTEVLEVLTLSLDISYERKGDKIYLSN